MFGARRRSSSIGQTIGNHRGGVALGTLATLAAPFIIRKLRARQASRAMR